MAVTARKRSEPTAEGGIGQFLREVFDELRKVVWPTWGELYRYTLVVIFTVIVLGIYIGGGDDLVGADVEKVIHCHRRWLFRERPHRPANNPRRAWAPPHHAARVK